MLTPPAPPVAPLSWPTEFAIPIPLVLVEQPTQATIPSANRSRLAARDKANSRVFMKQPPRAMSRQGNNSMACIEIVN
jgi:hypothetical protein